MSKATKRKHVTKEAVDDYFVPEGDEEIVKIFASRGNNLHEVENAQGERYLVSMPTKFRRNIWVKRGDFVVTEPIKEGNKVQGEIVYILLAKQIKYLKNEKLWPKEFDIQDLQQPQQQTDAEKSTLLDSNGNSCLNENDSVEADAQSESHVDGNNSDENNDNDSDSESSDNDDDLFVNPNHRPVYYMDESSEEESSEDESEEEEEEEDSSLTSNSHTEYKLEEGIAKVKLK